MKRLVALFLALVMCLSLCGCGKSKSVKQVEALIDAIGTVTEDSEHAITVAELMYHGLTAENKKKVSNYSTLVAARKAYDALPQPVGLTVDNFTDYFKITSNFGEMKIGETASKLEWILAISPARPGTVRDIEVNLKVTTPQPWTLSTQNEAYLDSFFDHPGWFTLKIRIPANGNYSNQYELISMFNKSMPQSNCTIQITSVTGTFTEK